MAKRVRWDLNNEVELHVMSVADLCERAGGDGADALEGFSLVFGIDLVAPPPPGCADALRVALLQSPNRFFTSSSPDRQVDSFWRGMTALSGASAEQLEDSGPFGLSATIGGYADVAKLSATVAELWHRQTAEEAIYAMLVLIDGAVGPLSAIQIQKPVPTSDTIGNAVGKCQEQFRNCFTQPKCLQSLQCLASCGMADQACSYTCIVSYQSKAFTEFTLCALQKNNLLNSQVERPTTPEASPIEVFRGSPITHDIAEDILVGHYDPEAGKEFGWLVAAGSNPAYEQFASQHQLWYRGAARGSFWYRPTFLVSALDGRKIWRTRDYRVRRAGGPGLWDFSVLDNGIISEERWHLLGVDDDLKWLVLFYVGAAKRAGIFYRGCLVLTPDGSMPTDEKDVAAVEKAVQGAGMRLWEFEMCTNPPLDPSNPPPLIAPKTQAASPLLKVPA